MRNLSAMTLARLEACKRCSREYFNSDVYKDERLTTKAFVVLGMDSIAYTRQAVSEE